MLGYVQFLSIVMKSILFLAILSILLVSCDANKRKASTAGNNCTETIRHFYNWYNTNYKQIDGLDFVTPSPPDSIYRVNQEAVKEYMLALKKSGLFSEKFLANKADFFSKSDSMFITLKQIDDAAIGFEADLLLISQEPEYYLENRNKMEFKESADSLCCIVRAKLNKDVLTFRLNSASYLIDSIYVE